MAKEGDQAIGSIKIKNPIELSYSENLANNALIIYVVKKTLSLKVIPPFLTEVISRIRSFVVDVALGYSHSTPCSAVRDYKTIATV